MAISLTCGKCGKTLKVKDEWAGKKVKCPGCGNVFPAIAGGGGGGGGGGGAGATRGLAGSAVAANPVVARKLASKTVQTKGKDAKVSVSWGLIAIIVFVVAIIGGILAFRLGPVRVWHQWEAIGGKASDDID